MAWDGGRGKAPLPLFHGDGLTSPSCLAYQVIGTSLPLQSILQDSSGQMGYSQSVYMLCWAYALEQLQTACIAAWLPDNF